MEELREWYEKQMTLEWGLQKVTVVNSSYTIIDQILSNYGSAFRQSTHYIIIITM